MKDMYARVIPRKKILKHVKPFLYKIPEGIDVVPGDIVRIPLRNSALWGVVWTLEHKKPPFPVKDIEEVVQAYKMPQTSLDLLEWFARYYHVSLPTAAHTFLPDFTLKPKEIDQSEITTIPLQIAKYRIPTIRRAVEELGEDPATSFRIGKRGETLAFYRGLVSKNSNASFLFLCPDQKSVSEVASALKSFSPVTVTSHTNRGQASAKWIIANNTPGIIIGTRLAAFLPFKHLDKIIIDQDHNDTHKNYGGNPRYDAREVVQQLATRLETPLLHVSPTPRIEAWHHSQQKESFTQQVQSTTLITLNPHEGLISSSLKNLVSTKTPLLILFNRKGLAKLNVCKACKHSYPADTLTCPKCSNTGSFQAGIGLDELNKRFAETFPKKTIHLLDADHPETVEADITLATIFALSRDLSKYKAIVILLADQFLGTPSFRANETSFHLFSSLGQSHRNVYIQTFNPDSPVIQNALAQNYEAFYSEELEQREMFGYPPFGSVVNIINKATGEEQIVKNPDDLGVYGDDIIIDRTPD